MILKINKIILILSVSCSWRFQKKTVEIERHRQLVDEHNRQMYDAKKKKDQLQSSRNELWKKETQLTHTLNQLKEELAKSDQNLRSMAGKVRMQRAVKEREPANTYAEPA